MDCYKLKILTQLRPTRKRNGTTCISCTAIDSQSVISVISSPAAELNNMTVGKYVVVTGHRLHRGQDKVFVTATESTKLFCTSSYPIKAKVETNFLNAPVLSIAAVLGSPEKTRCSVEGKVSEISPIKETPNNVCREIELEGLGQYIMVKAWDDNAELPFKKGQHVTVRNLRTNIFRGIVSLNTTDETDIEEAETTTEQKTVEIVGYNVNGTDIEC